MNYLRFGKSKKFLVFLHGWGCDLNSFLWIKDFFIDDFSLVFVDFAGFGKTPEYSKPSFVSDYVFDLKKLLDKFDIESLILVGHSFGGRVAIKYSFLFQNLYLNFGVCLVDSAGILPRKTLKQKFEIWQYKRIKAKSKRNEAIKNRLEKFGSEDYKKLSSTMKKTFVNIVNEDLSGDASFITKRACIIWGRNDKETKLFMARKLKKLIVNSSLHILDDCGHFSFLEKKQEFVIILDSFVKSL